MDRHGRLVLSVFMTDSEGCQFSVNLRVDKAVKRCLPSDRVRGVDFLEEIGV